MALPPKVIEQLGRSPAETPGWSSRLLMFSSTLFVLSLVAYLGLVYGYQPYLQGEIQEVDRRIKTDLQKIPATDREKIIVFFSQLSNLRSILEKHPSPSAVFALLEATTHPNIYYTQMALNTGRNEVVLSGVATSVADVTEQVKIFQKREEIKGVSLGGVNSGGKNWQFEVTLTLAPDLLISTRPTGGTAVVPSTSTSTSSASTSTSTSTSTTGSGRR